MNQGLASARSLDEVTALHRQFVIELDQQCGRGGEGRAGQTSTGGTHKHMWAAITRVLDQAVRYCSAHKSAAEAARALSESASKGSSQQVRPRLASVCAFLCDHHACVCVSGTVQLMSLYNPLPLPKRSPDLQAAGFCSAPSNSSGSRWRCLVGSWPMLPPSSGSSCCTW